MMDPQNSMSGRTESSDDAPYLLRSLAKDVPLSADGEKNDTRITCVEFWNDNLYIGTSAAEILHLVRIPPDPQDVSAESTFILASRLRPPVLREAEDGIQRILLLPAVGKAAILSNHTLSFYSLPELSPAFPRLKPFTCAWVGGTDQDISEDVMDEPGGVVIMMGLRNKIRMVRIGEEPIVVRDIEFGGCLTTSRRGDVACVADANSYALLDVVHQQKIPLFPISSFSTEDPQSIGETSQLSTPPSAHSRSVSALGRSETTQDRGHGRSSSLGVFSGDTRRHSSTRYGFDIPDSLSRMTSPTPRTNTTPPESTTERSASPRPQQETNKSLPPPPPESRPSSQLIKGFGLLRPQIASPTSTEFLLAQGNGPFDPGVGMFVNLDGEVVRGTIEFTSYPDNMVVDGKGIDLTASAALDEVFEEGYVLSVVRAGTEDSFKRQLEIQRWDVDSGEGHATKLNYDLESLVGEAPSAEATTDGTDLGIQRLLSAVDISLPEISSVLAKKRLSLKPSTPAPPSSPIVSEQSAKGKTRTAEDIFEESEETRERDELEIVRRLCNVPAKMACWSGDRIWWTVRNPRFLQLNARLEQASSSAESRRGFLRPDRVAVQLLLNDIRGLDPRTELDFFALSFIRQKAALLLFADLILRVSSDENNQQQGVRATEKALIESELDPRIILAFIPVIRDEIREGDSGLWAHNGLKDVFEKFLHQEAQVDISSQMSGSLSHLVLQLAKTYMLYWRKKRNFGSVEDRDDLFGSVDAALLHILLILDQGSSPGPATPGSVRQELNIVVDDKEFESFDRAVLLLEQYKRLYVLSRLYQSRKMSSKVLATWKRIISGEHDAGGEFLDGEQQLRRYLTKLKDSKLVREYAIWLANRNPKLGVQVFADDHSTVKFRTTDALKILHEHAPAAVKEYLEYLVFGKKQTQYSNELIGYYLDVVVKELELSEESKQILMQTYETYRALHPPKPTYRQFIMDNAIDAEWWQSRLRLLQLLGGTQDPASSYDTAAVLERLTAYEEHLVPEMIILCGRQGRHEEAIRLLTHGLGDFDTAVSYCLLGGHSLFRTLGDVVPGRPKPSREDQSRLFEYLLHEFFQIRDLSDRIERTGELLERFGPWFDVSTVLNMIPDSWAIDVFSGFLVSALRRLVRERCEAAVTKALSGAQNLKLTAELADRQDELGPKVEYDAHNARIDNSVA
ncbi:hypothetical protein P152DRAFT_418417 [Eremomyces bilateralis CBS 781.70]|uniref:CNH domain-containing protein n=1 Tax=Eremomyces bilateralis CBS 781.70 TaxID=1392243 RepID=A0A6G1G1D6_9PEZI|nr:uncharacterized protein P152DRAFT_418417 [Eremomyces bilateralis CBS 781.70]KAF1811741.1 hypothetical protein P152DRAFT_418417 [Eremomyces bilateralis CBS 781.70]